jgi:hypothetical protein
MKKLLLFFILCSSLIFGQANYVITKEDFPLCPNQNLGKTVNAVYGTVSNPTGAISAYRINAVGGYWLVTAHCSRKVLQVFDLSGNNLTNKFLKVNGLDFWYCFLVDKTGTLGNLELKVNMTGISPTDSFNHVVNGDLENWTSGSPDNWNLKKGIVNKAISDLNNTNCMHLISTHQDMGVEVLSDIIILNSGEHRFSFWFKSYINNGTGLQVYFREIGTNYYYGIDSNRDIIRKQRTWYESSLLLDSKYDRWSQYIGYFNAGINGIRIRFFCREISTEEIFIDDIKIKRIL